MGGKISSRAGIVIKYPNAVNLPESGAALPLPEHDALRWTNLVKKVQKESNVKLKIRPLFSHIDPKKLSALADLARAKDGRSHGAHVTPRFQNYLWVSFIGAQGTNATAKQDILRIAGECAAEINNWRGVERAYVRLEDKPAGLAQQANPIRLETVVASKQNVKHKCANHVHLDAAPTGVRAEGIWDYAGGDGTGQSFVDIEHSWYLKHVDLKKGGSEFAKFDGSNGGTMDVDKGHGTSVLGIVFGNQNSRGMTGIAPNISTATVISTWSDPEPLPTAEAVMLAAALHLKPAAAPAPVGGFVLDTNVVVLIELQAVVVGSDYNFPVEVYSETFAAIKALSDAGITVVEPAGNGSLADSGAAYSAVDLDSLAIPESLPKAGC